jgi:hypothetical protein
MNLVRPLAYPDEPAVRLDFFFEIFRADLSGASTETPGPFLESLS